MNLKLQAYDAPEELEARLVTAVYNCNGVLKGFYPAAQSFAPNTQTQVDIQLPGIVHELGDSYRVAVWEADGTPALEQPLQYRYSGAASDFYVPNVFSDHMLLQADKPLRVWGKAPAMSLVEVTLENTRGGQVVRETRVEKDSDWEVDMGSFSAGGQYTLTVRAGTEKRVFEDIVFGDVWLCVGQSNMDYYMLGGKDTEEYLDSEQGRREVNNPNIRLLNLWNKGVGRRRRGGESAAPRQSGDCLGAHGPRRGQLLLRGGLLLCPGRTAGVQCAGGTFERCGGRHGDQPVDSMGRHLRELYIHGRRPVF